MNIKFELKDPVFKLNKYYTSTIEIGTREEFIDVFFYLKEEAEFITRLILNSKDLYEAAKEKDQGSIDSIIKAIENE